MAYTALYRELRPKVFRDVIGQEHITTTLKNEIINRRIAHAYLFSGTRGTGKTTCAKIFSKALNCLDLKDGEPCNKCENCLRIDSGTSLDVMEMDAATNNKVDDIRDLIDEVHYPPQEGKYKVYILDEAHMLTMGAVNAFLKTLEEPPENVVFILATTDPQKLPITILSRCQRFDFKRIKASDIEKRLREIVDSKGIFSENNSLSLISRVSDGAMRDALSILDQGISMGGGKLDYDILVSMLGLVNRGELFTLTDSILKKDVELTLTQLDSMMDKGRDPYFITKDLLEHFRNILVTKIIRNNPDELIESSAEDVERYKDQSLMIHDSEIIKIVRILQNVEEQSRKSSQGRIFLELAMIKICNAEKDYGMDSLVSRMNQIEGLLKSGNFSSQNTESSKDQPVKERRVKAPESGRTSKAPESSGNTDVNEVFCENPESKLTLASVKSSWNEILEALRAKRQMVIRASLFEGVVVAVDKGIITVEFPADYSHNKKRLEKAEFKTVLDDTASMVLGEKVCLKFTVNSDDDPYKEKDFEQKLKDMNVTDINII